MTPAVLVADLTIPFAGILLAAAPLVTRPTVSFGVRVPPDRITAPVIRSQRQSYLRRTAVICVCATIAALALNGAGSWWLPRIILALVLAADLACLQLARRQVLAVKNAEHWFDGVRQTVVADTTWRADPPRFPLPWLLPAVAVIAATVVAGVLRYPHLPARLPSGAGGGHTARTTVLTAFAPVYAQAYVTALWTGMLVLMYRARPNIDPAEPAGTAGRYRAFLGTAARALLILMALVDASIALGGLRRWELWSLPAGLTPVPALLGLAAFGALLLRAGRRNALLVPDAGGAGRDDDRFWKAGVIYVNREDPATLVSARFGAGWTFNFANPRTWLFFGTLFATLGGLALLLVVAGR